MPSPNVSVIIPVYNREDTIAGCLNSVAGQTVAPTEIVLVDDGSTDGTKPAIETWKSENADDPFQIIYVFQENQGKSAALNAGVKRATGEWIAFNDSDDLWVSDKLERQFELLQDHPEAKVSISDSRFINDASLTRTNFEIRGFFRSTGTLEKPYRTLAENPNGFFMQTLLAHRDCVEKVFPLDPQLRVAQDIDLVFRLSLLSDFAVISEPLVEIDRTPARDTGLTKQHNLKSLYRLQTKERIIIGWLALSDPRIAEVTRKLKNHLSRTQHLIGLALKRQNKEQEGRAYLRQAVKTQLSPRTLVRYLLSFSSP